MTTYVPYVRTYIGALLNEQNTAGIASVTSSSDKKRFFPDMEKSHGSGKHGTEVMVYPSNVDSDPQQGHHIIFTLNEFLPGKLKIVGKKLGFEDYNKGLNSEGNFNLTSLGSGGLTSGEGENTNPNADQLPSGFGSGGIGFEESDEYLRKAQQHEGLSIDGSKRSSNKGGGSIQAERPTKKTGAVIALYMPPNIQVEYGVKYADAEIGTIAMLGKDIIGAFMSNKGDTISNLRAIKGTLGSNAQEGVTDLINNTLNTFADGARALQQIESGKVITPRMEIMFQGVGRRTFSYTFAFIPKSADEARTIEKIIYTFKHHMMPKYSNEQTRREMDIPGTFDITYMYQNQENAFINKVSSCFLTNVAVQYGADRYTAHESTNSSRTGSGPPPQKSKITLQFTELETLSKSMIEEGH